MTKDRSFFQKAGISKLHFLNSLANLYDEKKMKYDTRELVQMSKVQLKREIARIRGMTTRKGGGPRPTRPDNGDLTHGPTS